MYLFFNKFIQFYFLFLHCLFITLLPPCLFVTLVFNVCFYLPICVLVFTLISWFFSFFPSFFFLFVHVSLWISLWIPVWLMWLSPFVLGLFLSVIFCLYVCLNFSLFLSLFFPSVICGLWILGVPAKGLARTFVMRDPSPGCWATKELPTPWNSNQWECSQRFPSQH